MKIKKIKYNNHEILGDLELNFVHPNTHQPYDTVVFLGENGSGKTTILSTLTEFLNGGSIKPFEYIEYEADGVSYRAEPLDSSSSHLGFHNRVNLTDNTNNQIRRNSNNDRERMMQDREDPRSYSCVYSKARADYKTEKITYAKTSTIDSDNHDVDKTDNYTALKQLLVDISNQDNQDFVEFNKASGRNYSEFEPQSKMYRFSSAFNNFFPQMRFKKVADEQGEKAIKFEKHNKEISIDSLSTGEKQIVYRGVFLLKNSGNMNGGTVFIDEPELSMHPLWQKRILKYFKDLYYNDATNTQKAQMFFASHSDSVVLDAIRDIDKTLVIVLTDEGGTISAKHITAPIILPTVTNAEVNYHAFDLYSVDFHIALYGYLQTLTGCNRISDMDHYICGNHLFDNAIHSKATTHGTTHYNSLSSSIRNNIDHPDNGNGYSDEELKTSTELLIDLIKDWTTNHP